MGSNNGRTWRLAFENALLGTAILWLKVTYEWPGVFVLPAAYLTTSLSRDVKRRQVSSRRVLLHVLLAGAIGFAFKYTPVP